MDKFSFSIILSCVAIVLSSVNLTQGTGWLVTKRADEDNRFVIEYQDYANVTNGFEAMIIEDDGDVIIDSLKGSGNAYACLTDAGLLYRSNVSCVM